MFYFETFHIQLRVDPTYSEDYETPMRIALTRDDGGEMLEILTAFASMPDSVKLETLSILKWNVDREREETVSKTTRLIASPVGESIFFYVFSTNSGAILLYCAQTLILARNRNVYRTSTRIHQTWESALFTEKFSGEYELCRFFWNFASICGFSTWERRTRSYVVGLWVCLLFFNEILTFYLRVDPTAVCDAKQDTPMEIAVARGHTEVFKMLAEVAEITDKVKLMQLSDLISSDKPKRAKEEFETKLKSLPVDLVRIG